jgi:hypothetical protein
MFELKIIFFLAGLVYERFGFNFHRRFRKCVENVHENFDIIFDYLNDSKSLDHLHSTF